MIIIKFFKKDLSSLIKRNFSEINLFSKKKKFEKKISNFGKKKKKIIKRIKKNVFVIKTFFRSSGFIYII
tara:strand:+ start:58 stop:267 length:210 start_codon:yes stop_codon:yes gene_type:complete